MGVTEEGIGTDDLLCSRNARLRRPSLGLLARLGVPVGGRVRKLRAVEDQSASILGERKSDLGRESGETAGMVSVLAEPSR